MEFLYLLEKIRVPGLNEFMLGITTLGEETAFLAIGLMVFWCVCKRRGCYLMTVGLFGTIISQLMKIFCRVPRPWVQDKNFTILEQAGRRPTAIPSPAAIPRVPWAPSAPSPGSPAGSGCGSCASLRRCWWAFPGCISACIPRRMCWRVPP